MSKRDDGGPAFPYVVEGGEYSGLAPDIDTGMSLRDYFAGQALVVIIASADEPVAPSVLSKAAYLVADAMLEARKEGGAA